MIPATELPITCTVKRPPTAAEESLNATGEAIGLQTVGTLKMRINKGRDFTRDVITAAGKTAISTFLGFANLSGPTNSTNIVIETGWYIVDDQGSDYKVVLANPRPGGEIGDHQQLILNKIDT